MNWSEWQRHHHEAKKLPLRKLFWTMSTQKNWKMKFKKKPADCCRILKAIPGQLATAQLHGAFTGPSKPSKFHDLTKFHKVSQHDEFYSLKLGYLVVELHSSCWFCRFSPCKASRFFQRHSWTFMAMNSWLGWELWGIWEPLTSF